MLGQRGTHRAGQRLRQLARAGDVAPRVADRDRIHPPGALDHRRVHQRGQPRAVGGGRHRQQPQFRPQRALQVEAEGQREIGVQRALMHLVEHHRGDPVQPRIGLQPADQQALGHHLDAGRGGDRAVQPGAVADGLADGSAEQAAMRAAAARVGQAPRLQHHDAPVAAPGALKQGQRHQRGLAGAGRGDQYGVGPGRQRRPQGGQRVGHGKVGHLGRMSLAYQTGAALPKRPHPGPCSRKRESVKKNLSPWRLAAKQATVR